MEWSISLAVGNPAPVNDVLAVRLRRSGAPAMTSVTSSANAHGAFAEASARPKVERVAWIREGISPPNS